MKKLLLTGALLAFAYMNAGAQNNVSPAPSVSQAGVVAEDHADKAESGDKDKKDHKKKGCCDDKAKGEKKEKSCAKGEKKACCSHDAKAKTEETTTPPATPVPAKKEN